MQGLSTEYCNYPHYNLMQVLFSEVAKIILNFLLYSCRYSTYYSSFGFCDRMGKLLWLLLLPGINVVRYYVKNVKPPVTSELVNVAVQVAFDSLLYASFGPRSLGFLFLCTFDH